MFNIVIYWWYMPILLAVFPFIYLALRKPQGDYDLCFDGLLVTIACWVSAISILIGKLLF